MLLNLTIRKMESHKDVEGLLGLFKKYQKEWGKKQQIQQALGRIGEPLVEPLVTAVGIWAEQIEGVNSGIERVDLVEDATDILKTLDKSQLTPLLSLIKKGETRTRRMAIEMAGNLNYRDASGAILDALYDPSLQMAATSAFENIEDKAAMKGLLNVLENGSAEARENAAYAIGKLRMEENIPLLRDFLEDSSPDIRAGAVHWIGRMNDPSLLPVIAARLVDTDIHVRTEAVISIGLQNGNPYFDKLIKMLDSEEDDEFLDTIAETLGRLDKKRALQALKRDSKCRKKGLLTIIERAPGEEYDYLFS